MRRAVLAAERDALAIDSDVRVGHDADRGDLGELEECLVPLATPALTPIEDLRPAAGHQVPDRAQEGRSTHKARRTAHDREDGVHRDAGRPVAHPLEPGPVLPRDAGFAVKHATDESEDESEA